MLGRNLREGSVSVQRNGLADLEQARLYLRSLLPRLTTEVKTPRRMTSRWILANQSSTASPVCATRPVQLYPSGDSADTFCEGRASESWLRAVPSSAWRNTYSGGNARPAHCLPAGWPPRGRHNCRCVWRLDKLAEALASFRVLLLNVRVGLKGIHRCFVVAAWAQ